MSNTTHTKRRLAVISSSRADLAHLIHPLRALEACPELDLVVMAAGAMLQTEYGSGVQRLHSEGFHVEEVGDGLEIDSGLDAARAIGDTTHAFADAFDRIEPDLVMVVADRFEMLAPANAALAMRLPIVHVEGGERSEGAIDDAVRNALTKLSHLHLVTTKSARERVLALGEEPWRVHRVGAASLDHLHSAAIPSKASLEADLGIPLDAPLVLVGIHPVTLAEDPTEDARAVLEAIRSREERFLFAFPNADEGGRPIRHAVEELVASRERTHLFTNLQPETWFGLLNVADVIIGNSSSVLMESPSIPLPAICVGDRQAGRERAANVIDTVADPSAIDRALDDARALELGPIVNPYGDGHASERILEVLKNAPGRFELLVKTTTLRTADAAPAPAAPEHSTVLANLHEDQRE